jgi:hypothetical protein
MYGVLHSTHAGPTNSVTQFVGNLVDGHLLSAILQHLRHKRQGIKLTVLIESCENLVLAAHLHTVTNMEAQFGVLTDIFSVQPPSFPLLQTTWTMSFPHIPG